MGGTGVPACHHKSYIAPVGGLSSLLDRFILLLLSHLVRQASCPASDGFLSATLSPASPKPGYPSNFRPFHLILPTIETGSSIVKIIGERISPINQGRTHSGLMLGLQSMDLTDMRKLLWGVDGGQLRNPLRALFLAPVVLMCQKTNPLT